MAFASTAGAQAITNLHQLTQALNSGQQTNRDVDLAVTVCAASRPKVGVLIVQDETGVEQLQLGGFDREISPGERIRIRRSSCLLRKREMGIEISAMPVVNNDGLHGAEGGCSGGGALRAGKIPLRLEWFNYWRSFALNVAVGDFKQAAAIDRSLQSLARGCYRVRNHQLLAWASGRMLRGFLGGSPGFRSAAAG